MQYYEISCDIMNKKFIPIKTSVIPLFKLQVVEEFPMLYRSLVWV